MKKKALVIGLGMSGKAASRFLLSLGYEVFGVDQKGKALRSDLGFLELEALGLKLWEEGSEERLQEFSLVVVSPGVPASHPQLLAAEENKIEIIGEAELALRSMRQKAIAITGTNGKTTVTSLIEHVLLSSGQKAKAVGNIGIALTEYVLKADPEEIAVVELSSYQLETLEAQVFDVGLLLNITPDHLDRYPGMEAYAKAKIRIEKCLRPEGILYVSDEVVRDFGPLFSRQCTQFSEERIPSSFSHLSGHDRINAYAAFLACKAFGISEEDFLRGLASFRKPSHRVEFVKEVSGVQYYDDSKGTNIDAVVKAVALLEGSIVLIAGGVDKGASYLPWKEAFQGKVKQMFLIGQAALKIKEELGLFFNVQIVDSLGDAVQAASRAAKEGEIVLLSPGCSSFDMFRDYEHRGQEFQRFVRLLEEKEVVL